VYVIRIHTRGRFIGIKWLVWFMTFENLTLRNVLVGTALKAWNHNNHDVEIFCFNNSVTLHLRKWANRGLTLKCNDVWQEQVSQLKLLGTLNFIFFVNIRTFWHKYLYKIIARSRPYRTFSVELIYFQILIKYLRSLIVGLFDRTRSYEGNV